MTNHYAYQLHSAYKNLVSDIVHSLHAGDWAGEKEIMAGLPSIDSGIANLSIHFCVTKLGSIIVNATADDVEVAYWELGVETTQIDVSKSSIMSIGRLQYTFERFWDTFISKCTRVDMVHKCRGAQAPLITTRTYFADRVTRSWLEHGCLDLTIAPNRIRIANEEFRTHRAWRRNVRSLMRQDSQHENSH